MINILLSVNLIIFLFIVNFLLNQRKLIASLDNKCQNLEKTVELVIKDHPILVKADLAFSKQLREINRQLISMDTQLQGLENVRENDGGYQHALRILEMGGSREEIIENCHLTHAEAEFLMNLQAYRVAIKMN